MFVATFHGRLERATEGTPSPPVQRKATIEITRSAKFTLLLLVRSCLFEVPEVITKPECRSGLWPELTIFAPGGAGSGVGIFNKNRTRSRSEISNFFWSRIVAFIKFKFLLAAYLLRNFAGSILLLQLGQWKLSAGWSGQNRVADWRALFCLTHGLLTNSQLLYEKNSFSWFGGFVSYWKFDFRAVSCFKWYSQFFLRKCIRQQCMYLYNATTAVRFQPRQQKCSLLQTIPKHNMIILQVYNIIRKII